MRFLVDTMLGTLAKWLRVLGFDAVYAKDLDDDELLRIAVEEERIIISRDRELCGRKPDSIFINSLILDDQILQVVKVYPIKEEDILSRCLECNSVLEKASKAEALGKVPKGITERHDEFWRCNKCNKFYWAGSHWTNMSEKARRFIEYNC